MNHLGVVMMRRKLYPPYEAKEEEGRQAVLQALSPSLLLPILVDPALNPDLYTNGDWKRIHEIVEERATKLVEKHVATASYARSEPARSQMGTTQQPDAAALRRQHEEAGRAYAARQIQQQRDRYYPRYAPGSETPLNQIWPAWSPAPLGWRQWSPNGQFHHPGERPPYPGGGRPGPIGPPHR